MKIVGFQSNEGLRLGVVEGDNVIDLQAVDAKVPTNLADVLAKGELNALGDIAKKAPASARKPSCQPYIGRAREASATGRLSAARSRLDLSLPVLSSHQRDSSPPICCNAKMLQEGRKSDFSTTNQQAPILVST